MGAWDHVNMGAWECAAWELVWKHGSVGAWERGSMGAWEREHGSVQHGSVGAWELVWKHRSVGAWDHVNMGAWERGSVGAREHRKWCVA